MPITEKILAEIRDRWLRNSVLQNRTIIDCFLFKYNQGCQQFPDICCLNVSGFSNTIHVQINNLHKEIDKIYQMSVE